MQTQRPELQKVTNLEKRQKARRVTLYNFKLYCKFVLSKQHNVGPPADTYTSGTESRQSKPMPMVN